MMCRCISFDTEECDAFEIFKMLPLPMPKSLWEAKTRVEWEAEYSAYNTRHGNLGIPAPSTLVELVHLHQTKDDPVNRQKLDFWNSSTDNLSSMLNLAASMGG